MWAQKGALQARGGRLTIPRCPCSADALVSGPASAQAQGVATGGAGPHAQPQSPHKHPQQKQQHHQSIATRCDTYCPPGAPQPTAATQCKGPPRYLRHRSRHRCCCCWQPQRHPPLELSRWKSSMQQTPDHAFSISLRRRRIWAVASKGRVGRRERQGWGDVQEKEGGRGRQEGGQAGRQAGREREGRARNMV